MIEIFPIDGLDPGRLAIALLPVTVVRRVANVLAERVARGESVAVHCRQGIGRSSLIAAAVLVAGGTEPEAAWLRLEKARGRPVPDVAEQRAWVHQLRSRSSKR